MSDTKRIHIQGEIAETPSTDSKDSYSRYVFSVHSNGKYPVKATPNNSPTNRAKTFRITILLTQSILCPFFGLQAH